MADTTVTKYKHLAVTVSIMMTMKLYKGDPMMIDDIQCITE